MPEVQPAVQYADLRQQDHAARLGMWGFLSTEVLFFGGLMLMYVRYRMAYAEGFVEAAHSNRHRHDQHCSASHQQLSGGLGICGRQAGRCNPAVLARASYAARADGAHSLP